MRHKHPFFHAKNLPLLSLPLLLTACSDSQSDNSPQQLSLTAPIAPASTQCPLGGYTLTQGLDHNQDKALNDDEVTLNQTHCYQSGEHSGAQLIGRYVSGSYGLSAAEIVDFDKINQHIYVVNALSGQVDILDASTLSNSQTPTDADAALTLNNLTKLASLDVAQDVLLDRLGSVNSIAIYGDLLAVAIERGLDDDSPTQGLGQVAFYRLSQNQMPQFIHAVEVGALPDNVNFSPDGHYLVVANEGEPNSSYTQDPQGSVSIIDIEDNTPSTIARHADFLDFNQAGDKHAQITDMIKINGPDASVAQDLEPEYTTINDDSTTAWVSLQENNALAKVDLKTAQVTHIYPLGVKDYAMSNNALDASDKDDRINLNTYPGLFGLYQPDTLASVSYDGQTYILSANEGDARDYDAFSEEKRIEKLDIDSQFASYAATQDEAQLGRLKVTTSLGDTDQDGDYDQLYTYGARSFSIWDQDGNQVYDSGNDFESITAALLGLNFNNNNEENKGDSRSDDKGAEPEALTVGQVGDKTLAFIGLERNSGIMVYDISQPNAPQFYDYLINRDFDLTFEIDEGETQGDVAKAGDLGPEGFKFIRAEDSPTGLPWLIVGNEVSGTTSVYQFASQS
ncbi:MAG: choice-of-anchor I family protein [Vibrio sp.]